MKSRTNGWVVAAAALFFGAIFSRVIEPGVRVEKILLANTEVSQQTDERNVGRRDR